MRKRLGLLPGGANKYVDTLRKCLEFVLENNPSKEELTEWFKDIYHSKSEKMLKDYIDTVKNLQLIVEVNNSFLLSDIAKEFLKTQENKLIYQRLETNYLGIREILHLLYENPRTLDKLPSFLNEKIGVTWQEGTQWKIRLNWLRSLEYVAKDGSQYRLTMEGQKIFETEIETEEEMPGHDELRDWFGKVGARLGFFSKIEYPINHFKVDLAWKQNEADKSPFAVFEIHDKGNLLEALVRLKYARTSLRTKPFLITNRKNMLKAKSLVNATFPELVKVVQVLHWTYIYKLEELAKNSSEMQDTTGLQIQIWVIRKPEYL